MTSGDRMLRDLRRVCVTDPGARRQAVLDSLHAMGCAYTLHHAEYKGSRVTNIVVPLRSGSPKLILGAHYDSVPNSTGANDNGAAVCILLELIHSHPVKLPVEVVFFDLEEGQMKGSSAYATTLDPSDVQGMINLDLCGVGDCLILGPRKHVEQPPFAVPISKVQPAYASRVIEQTPPSDDIMFEYLRIPALSVCMATAADAPALEELAYAMHQHRAPDQVPALLETMHNGPRDSIETVEVSAMCTMLNWLVDVLAAFEREGDL